MGDMSAEMPTPQESEAKNFRELRESLVHLGQVEPGLICETTKDGKPEVIIIPNSYDWAITYHAPAVDTTVAVTDDKIRILDVQVPWHREGSGDRASYISKPILAYFQPDENGEIRTEEEIARILKNAGPKTAEGQGGRISDSNAYEPTQKMQLLLASLFNRNESNLILTDRKRAGEYMEKHKGAAPAVIKPKLFGSHSSFYLEDSDIERYKTVHAALNPETLTPGENLAARFNTLAQQLKPPPQAKPV